MSVLWGPSIHGNSGFLWTTSNLSQPILTKWPKRVYRLLLNKYMQIFAIFYLHWFIFDQSHLYNKNISSFCLYIASKSLQKTPLWIIMSTLLGGDEKGINICYQQKILREIIGTQTVTPLLYCNKVRA